LRIEAITHHAILRAHLDQSRRGAHKTIGIASVAVALVLTGTVAWLLNKPPTADCGAEAPADHAVLENHPIKVVVQPWLGVHQVYGIFMVPNRYTLNKKYAFAMAVRGFDRRFAVVERADKQYTVDDVLAGPGHYLLRIYVPTRVAVWFLVKGLFGDLRNPCNWTLMFIERTS